MALGQVGPELSAAAVGAAVLTRFCWLALGLLLALAAWVIWQDIAASREWDRET